MVISYFLCHPSTPCIVSLKTIYVKNSSTIGQKNLQGKEIKSRTRRNHNWNRTEKILNAERTQRGNTGNIFFSIFVIILLSVIK